MILPPRSVDARDDPGFALLKPFAQRSSRKIGRAQHAACGPVHTIPVKKPYYLAFAGLGVPGSENTKRSKRPVLSPLAAFAGVSNEARQARADERAAKLAPIIKALQAKGVTSLSGIAHAHPHRSRRWSMAGYAGCSGDGAVGGVTETAAHPGSCFLGRPGRCHRLRRRGVLVEAGSVNALISRCSATYAPPRRNGSAGRGAMLHCSHTVQNYMGYPPTARRRAAIARTARTDERARKLAPIIKALQPKGITSLTSRRRNPFDCAARVVASEAVVVKTFPPLERAATHCGGSSNCVT
jgi:hypothetical protein